MPHRNHQEAVTVTGNFTESLQLACLTMSAAWIEWWGSCKCSICKVALQTRLHVRNARLNGSAYFWIIIIALKRAGLFGSHFRSGRMSLQWRHKSNCHNNAVCFSFLFVDIISASDSIRATCTGLTGEGLAHGRNWAVVLPFPDLGEASTQSFVLTNRRVLPSFGALACIQVAKSDS